MKKMVTALLMKSSFFLKSDGSSMLPILHSGDVIEYKKSSFKKLKVNDIILVKKKGAMMTHRVIYKSSSYLITKGDNNPDCDGKINPRHIIAQATQIKRDNRVTSIDQMYLIQSSLYFQEIIKIKQAFEREDVDFLFLKGLPFHLYFEGSHPKRIYADCDVLISRECVSQVNKILIENGYKKADIHWSQTVKKMQERDVEVTYYTIVNGFTIVFDIHLQIDLSIVHLGKLEVLYPQHLVDHLTTECLQTKKQIKVNNEKFSILNTRFFIIYLALHLFHHNFSGSFRYDFLDKVIKKTPNPDQILKQVQDDIMRFRLQNFVYPVFILLKKYYQTPLSQRFLHSIKPVNPLIREFVNHHIVKINIFNDESRISAGITRFKNLFYLSPNPWWKKMWIFFNPQIMYTVFWVIWRRFKRLFSSFLSRKRVP